MGLHERIMELEDELPCKASQTSGVCVHLNPIYVFNGRRPGGRDGAPPSARSERARLTDGHNRKRYYSRAR